MSPSLRDGDYVVLRRYGRTRKPGSRDVVVYTQPGGPTRIKRLANREADTRFSVQGDGPLSAPSVDLGLVPIDWMIGKVIHVIRPSGPASLDVETGQSRFPEI